MSPPDPSVPKPPPRPDPAECCRRGCEPCILDYYDRALARWEAAVRRLGLDPDAVREAFERGRDADLSAGGGKS